MKCSTYCQISWMDQIECSHSPKNWRTHMISDHRKSSAKRTAAKQKAFPRGFALSQHCSQNVYSVHYIGSITLALPWLINDSHRKLLCWEVWKERKLFDTDWLHAPHGHQYYKVMLQCFRSKARLLRVGLYLSRTSIEFLCMSNIQPLLRCSFETHFTS